MSGWEQGRHGFEHFDLGRLGLLSVGWSSSRDEGYEVTVLGLSLRRTFRDIEVAKAAAEKAARSLLKEALSRIPYESNNG